MTRAAIDLGGAWWLRESLGDTWQWHLASPLPDDVATALPAVDRSGWLRALVPGSVITDLERAGEISDPRFERNSRHAEWTAARHWVYRRRVHLGRAEVDALSAGALAQLVFDGVDPAARVFVDGDEVARATGPYRQHWIDVTLAIAGRTTFDLAVVVEPVPPGEPQVGRTDRVRRHAPRLNEGWDFCPRFPHQGIWRPVRLEIGATLLQAPRLSAAGAGPSGQLRFSTAFTGPTPRWQLTARLPDGRSYSAPVRPAEQQVSATIEIPHPPLWQPWGFGQQHLVDVELVDEFGNGLWNARTGFREIRWTRNSGSDAATLPYSLEVNGHRVPGVGFNWTPVDAQFGATAAARVEHLLHLARQAGGRVLRVWGGGLLETPDFYALCDELGLLVWQEFSQSSSGMQSAPCDAPDFLSELTAAAAEAVRRRHHHPSLVLWDGGNELQGDRGPLGTDDSAALRTLAAVIGRDDPDRGWLPTSPSGPTFAYSLDSQRADPTGLHDVHGPWEHQGLGAHAELYNQVAAQAHTEFGVEGMAGARQLAALIAEPHRWPPTRDNPVYRHLGEWWVNTALVDQAFGGALLTPEPANSLALAHVRRTSQLLQSTGLSYAVEADRRRWPGCSLVLPWQLNESFPNTFCTARVDFNGDAKPALWSAGRGFAPQRATIAVPADILPDGGTATAWVWDEDRVACNAPSRLEMSLRDLDGTVRARTVADVAAWDGEPVAVAHLMMPPQRTLGPILFWEARWFDVRGTVVDTSRRLTSTVPDWGPLLTDPALQVSAEGIRHSWPRPGLLRVENRDRVAVVQPHLWPGTTELVRAPIAVDLLAPGESFDVPCDWPATRTDLRFDWVNNPGLPITIAPPGGDS